MESKILELIQNLTNINSPSGNAYNAISYVKQKVEHLGYSTQLTNKGALIITVEGEDNERQRCITAHVDTLGAMVKEIKEDGRLTIDLIGGFKYNAIEGEYCQIETDSGETYTGTICLHETSVHVYRENEKIPRDKASLAMILDLLERIKNEQIKLPHTIQFYISNNEEIGYGANASISNKIVEFIAFDMGALGEGQSSDEYTVSICAKDASGPYHKELKTHLVNLCKFNHIPYKIDIYPYYTSDASAALKAGADIKHDYLELVLSPLMHWNEHILILYMPLKTYYMPIACHQ